MAQIHPSQPSLIPSEYQLINTQRFKTEMRATRIVTITETQPQHIHPQHTQTQTQYHHFEETVELPLSHSHRAHEEKTNLSKSLEKGFAADNRKQIEDVIYGEVYTYKINPPPTPAFSIYDQPESEQKENIQQYPAINKQLLFTEIKPFSQTEYSWKTKQMVTMYERLNVERKKYREAGYFKKKQRDIQQIELDQLFQNYQQTAIQQAKKQDQIVQTEQAEANSCKHEENSSQQVDLKDKQGVQGLCRADNNQYISPPIQTVSEDQRQQPTISQKYLIHKINPEKQCQLCKMSKFHIKHSKNSIIEHKNETLHLQPNQQVWEIEEVEASTQAKPMLVNQSPTNQAKLRYLNSEDKNQFDRRGIKLQKVCYEQGKIKKQLLNASQLINSKQHLFTTQSSTLQSLAHSVQRQFQNSASTQIYRSPRRKIFAEIKVKTQSPYIKIQHDQRQAQGANRMEQVKLIRSNIFSSNSKSPQTHKKPLNKTKEKQISTKTSTKAPPRQINSISYRQELVDSRVSLRSKEKEKQGYTSKKSIVPSLKLLEMSAQVRKWHEDNRKEIIFNAERICSYDLINRHMTQQEISNRLFTLINGMVEPRKWVLLMVDQVYGRLKEHYVAE